MTILKDLFAAVSAAPEAVAVHDGQSLTYRQLWRNAGAVARALRKAGCPVGGQVVLGLPAGRRWVAGLIGIWRAGAVPVLCDVEHPEGRLRQVTGAADYVLGHAAVPSRFWPENLELVRFSDEVEDFDDVAPRNASPTACVLHTSGTTGPPKPVLLDHVGLAHRIRTLRSVYAIKSSDKVAQLAATSTDVVLWETLLALVAGARLDIPLGVSRVPGSELVRWATQRDVTVASLTPTMLAAMPEVDLPALRLLVLGGERLDPRRHAFWIEGHQVANAYGPTEATIETHVCPRVSLDSPAPIGRPVYGVDDFLLDEFRAPVADGHIGELYVGGIGLALGYDGLAGATASAFLEVAVDGQLRRLYRTGDLAYRRPDGQLVFVGRRDRQLNLGGVRLEPAEVEQAARQLPGVAAATVVADGPPERQQLVLHVDTRENGPSVAALRAHLAQLLPAAAVPSRILVHPDLPATDTGTPTAVAEAPGLVGLPERVAGWWAEATGAQPVAGVEFFDGGDSLAAVKLVHLVNEAFHTAITISDFVAEPTPDMLARVLADRCEESQ